MVSQKTLRRTVKLEGIGLHSGARVRLTMRPAAADAGVCFRRVDLTPAVEIPARVDWVGDTSLATVLSRDGVQISTVEHCLGALAGLGVDNAVVEVDGPELPILDGSALPYVEALTAAGLRRQDQPRLALRVEKALRIQDGDKFCILRPAERFRITYVIDFDGRYPESQHYFLDIDPTSFVAHVCAARTFGFLEDVEYLRSVGKARGGSLENAVVLDNGRVLNPEGLRMPDELVRHKILDAVGDLSLAGLPLLGHAIIHKGGHALHVNLMRALLARPDAFSVVRAGSVPARRSISPRRPTAAPVALHA